ncbi:general transcription factor IIF subunit 1-like [Mizuhopecten yessoensis]|uniref:Transcription initiation factor IIF subunit alpha n=1 Tax=Mizuhopecten yessoensis TaxID=6573 RepID=A0A210PWH8_MIZYE|nr:general transcription factor IIF subunit 1-like [Mizuhopecten yessoensis]OWF40841.1 General transcription factor IIF subunit 1 [Mizuhopecten yessoensis]
MATSTPQPQPSGSSNSTQEYVVRVPKDRQKQYRMMKFSSGANIDFAKLAQEQTPVRMERENNLKEYKTAHGIDMMPKFGAGSEFGREQKETARRKKYGIMMKRYVPNNQPWLMKVGKAKEAKKFKGVREGTIAENTSYYIFTQCPDGAFEAFPIEEWYNFSPMVQYKYLNSEEAEEEFTRRDKTLNYFSIMVRKRIKNEEDADNAKLDEEEKVKEKSQKKKKQGFLLTDDMDDEEEESDDGYDDEDENKGSEDKKPKKKTKRGAKPKKTAKHNSDDEAVEESDEGDFDDRELDYITDSDSSLSETGDREKSDHYQEKGVDEERGLKKLLDSDESSEDEEEKKKQEEKEKEEAAKKEKKKKDGSDSDSSSSSSDSDSDIEKDEKISSAIFMQKKEKRVSPVPRAATPSSAETEDKNSLKRKLETEAQVSKKMRTDSPSLGAHGSSSGGITEESIRRYLMRKPMTTKELLHKFKSKRVNMTKDAMMSAIATLLKKISPKKEMVKNVMYLSLKKDG